MKVTYLKHSGYVVEEGDTMLVFDYYKGALPEIMGQVRVYVFVSHIHYDHFNKQIFEWARWHPNIRYILSDDIKILGLNDKLISIEPCRTIHVDEIEVRTLRSTDEGVAFLVRIGERMVYHGGDLNWWHWEEESKAYNEMMRRKYRHEIDKLEGESIDAAFLPLDPRQEEQYAWGFDYFMRHTDTKYAFPMHMWGQYDICGKLLKDPVSMPYRRKIMSINRPGQIFLL